MGKRRCDAVEQAVQEYLLGFLALALTATISLHCCSLLRFRDSEISIFESAISGSECTCSKFGRVLQVFRLLHSFTLFRLQVFRLR